MHYLQNRRESSLSLKAYIQDYLKQEVFEEGLIRNMPAFSRFFDAIAFSHGELTNYANIARDCGIDAKTVKEYYQILVDTLLGIMVEPFAKKQNRQIINKTPKFYLFDVGVAGALMNRQIIQPQGEEFGRAFEHFILMEIRAYGSYSGKDYSINFWRTKSGLEVDFILNKGEMAIEVKGSRRLDSGDLKALRAFSEEYSPRRAICVCNEPARRVAGSIELIPWKQFLDDLWLGRVL